MDSFRRVSCVVCAGATRGCFNPCFNGFLSESVDISTTSNRRDSFNPCFNGFLSERRLIYFNHVWTWFVSILVLMDSFRRDIGCGLTSYRRSVSILVLMDSFRRGVETRYLIGYRLVSILVLMDSFRRDLELYGWDEEIVFQSLF